MHYWFYVRTSDVTSTDEGGKKVVRYWLASTMSEMRPLTRVTPGSGLDPLRVACNKAFALVCRYFGGCDLVEEMVASKCWPPILSWGS